MSIAEQAKEVYERNLREHLEATHRNMFVAIEPVSRDYFLGDTFIKAAMSAKAAYPNRTSFVLRIGHDAAFHMGSATS